ncbi:MAG: hypothetical protein ACYC92_07155 [Candidatus Acidiferrales bacterium]
MRKHLGNVRWAFAAVILFIAGCSHAVFPTGGNGGGNGTSPVILSFHDTPPSGVTVTSFEVTITGAVLQPGNVSLLATPQTIELTQLQTNSVVLSTTQVAPATYTSLQITYANPQFTFLNDSGVPVTVGAQTCNAGASCVVATPTVTTLTDTVSGTSVPPFQPLNVSSTNQTLLEFDVNLNNIIQPNFSLDFSKSGAVTATQLTGVAGTSVIDNINVAGQVGSVTTNQFQMTTSGGQTLTVGVNSGTLFQFAGANCTNNDFTCVAAGQIVDANVNVLSDGTFAATEIDFDDATGTQQVSGTIVSETGTPPTSFQMVVHNTVPPVASLPFGTPVTVTIGNTTSFVINNGLFVLPTGVTFATTSDLLVGQEVEARVASGSSISNGPPPSFTTDRLALEQTQLEATVSSVSPQASPFPLFVLSPLPALFSQSPINPATRLQILVTGVGQTSGTVFQDLTPENIGGLTVAQPVTVGGFLFNTTGTVGSPTIVAETVRGEVSGT